MKLLPLLDDARIVPALESQDKNATLRALAALFAVEGGPSLDEVYRVLSEREALASTGVGGGVAIPTGHLPGLSRIKAAVAIHRQGVPFDAVDGEPVHLFLAVLAPEEQHAESRRVLASVSRLLRDEELRRRLLESEDARAVIRTIADAEREASR